MQHASLQVPKTDRSIVTPGSSDRVPNLEMFEARRISVAPPSWPSPPFCPGGAPAASGMRASPSTSDRKGAAPDPRHRRESHSEEWMSETPCLSVWTSTSARELAKRSRLRARGKGSRARGPEPPTGGRRRSRHAPRAPARRQPEPLAFAPHAGRLTRGATSDDTDSKETTLTAIRATTITTETANTMAKTMISRKSQLRREARRAWKTERWRALLLPSYRRAQTPCAICRKVQPVHTD